jgi:hypothetical protein
MQLGNVLRAPWVDDANTRAERVPLPEATRCHAVAGSLGAVVAGARTRLGDDGLVPVASALGRHEDASRRLVFATERQAVVQETGHLDLLSSAEVSGLLQQWLA